MILQWKTLTTYSIMVSMTHMRWNPRTVYCFYDTVGYLTFTDNKIC